MDDWVDKTPQTKTFLYCVCVCVCVTIYIFPIFTLLVRHRVSQNLNLCHCEKVTVT